MVDRSETMWKSKRGILHYAEWGEVEVSQNDTVTLSNFDSTKALLFANLVEKDSGTEHNVANSGISIALNVITVVSGLTNEKCVYEAYGYKA